MNGLLKEVVFPIDQGRWVVERHWNLNDPQCPIVCSPYSSPYHTQLGPKDIYVEQRILSEAQYRELFGTRGHEAQDDHLAQH